MPRHAVDNSVPRCSAGEDVIAHSVGNLFDLEALFEFHDDSKAGGRQSFSHFRGRKSWRDVPKKKCRDYEHGVLRENRFGILCPLRGRASSAFLSASVHYDNRQKATRAT